MPSSVTASEFDIPMDNIQTITAQHGMSIRAKRKFKNTGTNVTASIMKLIT